MHKSISNIYQRAQKLFIILVEDVNLLTLLLVFALVVSFLGLVYYILTPFGHGIAGNDGPFKTLSIGQGLYFSIVTVSSLGYGDMHPVGAAKIIACVEVLFGLAVMGILIAKITSRRLSYHVLRLFSSDAQKRLEGIATGFEKCGSDLSNIMPELVSAFEKTPGQSAQKNARSLLSEFQTVVVSFGSNCLALSEYFSYEIKQGDYFSIAPTNSVARVGEAVDRAFMVLGQLIISLPPQARTEALDRRNRQTIAQAIAAQKKVCSIISKHMTDNPCRDMFDQVAETCERVPESYFAIPEESQPDQILEHTDQPQQEPTSRDDAVSTHLSKK